MRRSATEQSKDGRIGRDVKPGEQLDATKSSPAAMPSINRDIKNSADSDVKSDAQSNAILGPSEVEAGGERKAVDDSDLYVFSFGICLLILSRYFLLFC